MFESVEGKNKNNSFHLFGKQETHNLKKETNSFKQKFRENTLSVIRQYGSFLNC